MKITVAANPGRTARTSSIRRLTTLSLMTAIIILMAYTPIGYIDLPLIKATLIHVPVILGALLLGPADGLFLGGVFGVTSILKNTMAPAILSFAFSPLVPVPGTQSGSPWALFICFVPRMLIGVTPWLVCRGLERIASGRLNHTPIPAAVAGAVGAITNTALVMGTIALVFPQAYATANNIPVDGVIAAILGVVAANGIPEAIVAVILTPVLYLPLRKALGKAGH